MSADVTRLAMALLAVDPDGLAGVVLDHPLHEHARDFVNGLHRLMPSGAPQRRVPIGVSADRLLGGVDLTATLVSGRLVAERGVLASADGGVVVLPMAERLSIAVRTVLASVLDTHQVLVERDGIAARHPAQVVCVLIDESLDEEAVHAALVDRVAFVLTPTCAEDDGLCAHADAVRSRVRDAAHRVRMVSVEERWFAAICETAEAFGITSVRVPLLALRCARAHAAYSGRLSVVDADAEAAVRLVLAPRATRLPVANDDLSPEALDDDRAPTPPQPDTPKPAPAPPPDASHDREPDAVRSEEEQAAPNDAQRLPDSETDILRAAVAAAIPPGLLTMLLSRANDGNVAGRQGDEHESLLRGRPRGVRTGMPRGGARLHLLETLRAAAPWQRLRTGARSGLLPGSTSTQARRLSIRREDLRVRRFVERTGTTVLFVVDASGSSALNRLAEAKGAIELLLAESYARRDRVSLIAFRGVGSEVLLQPTRALARAKHVLGSMPGGGGTPMAAAIDRAIEQGLLARRAGSAPLIVMLTDGRANIARDGSPGRAQAEQDALLSARALAASRIPALFVDTSTRGEAGARRLSEAMGARYVLLPSADARALGGLVKSAIAGGVS